MSKFVPTVLQREYTCNYTLLTQRDGHGIVITPSAASSCHYYYSWVNNTAEHLWNMHTFIKTAHALHICCLVVFSVITLKYHLLLIEISCTWMWTNNIVKQSCHWHVCWNNIYSSWSIEVSWSSEMDSGHTWIKTLNGVVLSFQKVYSISIMNSHVYTGLNFAPPPVTGVTKWVYHESSLYWPIIGLRMPTWSVTMCCLDPAGQCEFFLPVTRLKILNWMYCYRELIVGIVVSAIAVFRLVDNILSSSLHC